MGVQWGGKFRGVRRKGHRNTKTAVISEGQNQHNYRNMVPGKL